MVVLASSVEHVIGIDPDRDRVTASVVDTGYHWRTSHCDVRDHPKGI